MILKQPYIADYYAGESPIDLSDKPLAAIFRASYQVIGGRTRAEDSQAVNYANQAKAAGVKYGLYHFLTVGGIAEQAALFLSVWNKCGGASMAPIVDVEIDLLAAYNGAYGNAVWQSNIKTFLDLVSVGTGLTPMIYTSKNFWQYACTKNLLGQLTPPVWTADYPLWLAWYPTTPDSFAAPPASVLPAGWTTWAMWQYNDAGRSNGFKANDLNLASPAFAAQLGSVVVPPVVIPPVVVPPVIVNPGVTKTHQIDVMSDGSIVVDGKQVP